MDVHNVVAIFLVERYLYVGVFTSLLGENLDPKVVILMGGAAAIVAVHLAVQNNGRCAWGLLLTGYLELFRRDGLEFTCLDRSRVTGGYAQNNERIGENHQKSTKRQIRPPYRLTLDTTPATSA